MKWQRRWKTTYTRLFNSIQFIFSLFFFKPLLKKRRSLPSFFPPPGLGSAWTQDIVNEVITHTWIKDYLYSIPLGFPYLVVGPWSWPATPAPFLSPFPTPPGIIANLEIEPKASSLSTKDTPQTTFFRLVLLLVCFIIIVRDLRSRGSHMISRG